MTDPIPDAVRAAQAIATRAHAGQLDKIGAAYIDHPAMVADLVVHVPGFAEADDATRTATLCAAWLHDTVEDTEETAEGLLAAGIPEVAVAAVVALTRTDEVPSEVYYAGVRRDPVALMVKVADVASNLAPHRARQVDEATRLRLAGKYAHALDDLGVDRGVVDLLHAHLQVIDLHTHTSVSDGTVPPAELVRQAHAQGVTVLGITDHDIVDGWDEADAAAAEVGIEVVHGIEMTVRDWDDSRHLLAYLPDPTDPDLLAMLERTRGSRLARMTEMVRLVDQAGYPVTLVEVLEQAGAGTLGKPHLADALVQRGYFPDRKPAFDALLNEDRPTYVPRWSPTIEDAIRTVRRAGGVPVLAHPWARNLTITKDRLVELKRCGLLGIEVAHPEQQDTAVRVALGYLAADLDLLVTGSSDHHGTKKAEGGQLGGNTTSPAMLARLRALAGRR